MDGEIKSTEVNEYKVGLIYGILAFTLWGILPLYWKLLKIVPAEEILAHRILWSCVFVTAILLMKKDIGLLKNALSNRKNLVLIGLSSLLISVNWFTYIWAVNSNFVVEASMGYYINPLIVSFLGMTILKEKFNSGQMVALILATIGVLILAVQYGRIPWIALILAITFAFYGLMKKMLTVNSMIGLALETIIITPIALIFIISREVQGIGSLTSIPTTTLILLIFSGAATATPLLWFAKGAQRIPFSTIGFLQYIAPSISLFLGVFLFKEEFSKTHFISFGFIWTALAIYTISKARGVKTEAFKVVPKDECYD